jgi:hypothetical protein
MGDIAGFDSVELVMSVEDTFGISISNREAEKLMSVGDLCQYVAARVKARPDERDVCPTAAAFYRVRHRIASDSIAAADSLRPSTPTAELLGPGPIRNEWRMLAVRLGLSLPQLQLGRVTCLVFASAWIIGTVASSLIGDKLDGAGGAVAGGAIGIFILPLVLFVVCVLVAKRLGNTIPSQAKSVGDLVYLDLLKRKTESSTTDWTERELEAIVRYLVAESAGLPVRRIRRGTTFMELNAITG